MKSSLLLAVRNPFVPVRLDLYRGEERRMLTLWPRISLRLPFVFISQCRTFHSSSVLRVKFFLLKQDQLGRESFSTTSEKRSYLVEDSSSSSYPPRSVLPA